jgi:uncharacterized protein YegP (UPF0339 family)
MSWLSRLFRRAPKPEPIIRAVEVRKGPSSAYHSVLIAGNHEVVYSSETYSSRGKCVDTAEAVAKQLGVPLR